MKKKVTVNNPRQKNYTYYLTQPIGKNFDPEFKPDLTPKEMLDLGIFGGMYFQGDEKEFPKSWFKKSNMSKKKDISINYFQVDASQPLKVWREKGWIYPEDPRGWFQWYCRYYLGRRIPDEDQRQIKRWKMMKRHIAQIKNNCPQLDLGCRKKQRQALLHWAYDSRKI